MGDVRVGFFFKLFGFVLNFSLNSNLVSHLMFAKVFTWPASMGLRFKPSNTNW